MPNFQVINEEHEDAQAARYFQQFADRLPQIISGFSNQIGTNKINDIAKNQDIPYEQRDTQINDIAGKYGVSQKSDVMLNWAKEKQQFTTNALVGVLRETMSQNITGDRLIDEVLAIPDAINTTLGKQMVMGTMQKQKNAGFSDPSFNWTEHYQKQGLTPEQAKEAYEYKVGLRSRPRTGQAQKDELTEFDKLYTMWSGAEDDRKPIYEKELNKRYPEQMQSIREAGNRAEQINLTPASALKGMFGQEKPKDKKTHVFDDIYSQEQAKRIVDTYYDQLINAGYSPDKAQALVRENYQALMQQNNDYPQIDLQTAQSPEPLKEKPATVEKPEQAKPLDKQTAMAILQEAKGDKELARKLAIQRGYSL